MNHYLKFDFELGYGVGLPVIVTIDNTLKALLEESFQKDFSDDEYVAFDENYVSLNSIIQSAEFFETNEPIPHDLDQSTYIINCLLDYLNKPYEFKVTTTVSHSKTSTPTHTLSKEEQAVEDFIKMVQPFLEKERLDPHYPSDKVLTRLGQDPRHFSSLEDLMLSAQLFGICPRCDSVRLEDGCLTCQSYGDE